MVFINILDSNFIIDFNEGNILMTIIFIIFSYFFGILIHEIGQILEKHFFKKVWGGFPSERFLLEENGKYSHEHKNRLKKIIESEYNLKLNNTKEKNQEAFNLIYSKVQKKEGKDRIQLFNVIYGMCRSLFSGVIVSCFIFIIKFFLELGSNNVINLTYIFLFGFFSYLLFRRSTRFSERFADYVYRDFYNYYAEKQD